MVRCDARVCVCVCVRVYRAYAEAQREELKELSTLAYRDKKLFWHQYLAATHGIRASRWARCSASCRLTLVCVVQGDTRH